MNFPQEYIEIESQEERAAWRKANTKPPVIDDFVQSIPNRSFYDIHGNKHVVTLGLKKSGEPVFMTEPPDHYEDHQWKYPAIGDLFVLSGNAKAIENSVDFVTYKKAKTGR